MKKTKIEKGITLVALIITIVVILILAAVVIGRIEGPGLIEKVKLAVAEWKNAENDEKDRLNRFLPYLETEEDKKFKELKKYILGENLEGRVITEILSDTTFIDEDTTLENASETIEYMALDSIGTERIYYIKYNNKIYNILAKAVREGRVTTITTDSLELIYEPKGSEGTQVLYDSNGNGLPELWTVLTDRNGKLELINNEIMKDADGNGLTIGKLDSTIEATQDLDGTGEVDEDDNLIASAIIAWNESVADINDFCDEQIIATDNGGVRSIGASSTATGTYSSEQFDSWFQEKGISLATTDLNYKEDYAKLLYFGMSNVNDTDYWYASRCAEVAEGYEDYYLRIINASGTLNSTGRNVLSIFEADEDFDTGFGTGNKKGYTLGVRPVIINPQKVNSDEYIVPATGEESIVENVLLGDIDKNGNVSQTDNFLLLQIINNTFGPVNDYVKVAADIDANNIIDYRDSEAFYDIMNGQIELTTASRDAGQIKIQHMEY